MDTSFQHSPNEVNALVASVFAHSIVYFAREQAHGADLLCGPDPPAPTTNESMDSVMQAYVKNLPQLLQVAGQNILPYEQALINANKTLAPQQNQLSYDLLQKFGPQFTQLGTELNKQSALGQAGTDLAVLQGPGKELAAAQLEAQRQADPEYYKSRELALSALSNLFGGLPDAKGGLSGAEREEMNRSVSRDNAARGNEAPTATSTVENAMRFGKAGEDRAAANQSRISQAVNTATTFMPAAKSGVDVFQLTTGRPAFSNPGQSQFAGVSQNTGNASQQMGGNLFNTTAGMQSQANQINANRRDSLDRFSQVMGSMPNVSCCWIFLTAHGGELPWYVRYARNVYGTDATRRGYKRMSRWLVPLMQRSALARWVVRFVMTEPLAMFAGYKLRAEGCEDGWVFRPLRNFWFRVWNKLGEKEI